MARTQEKFQGLAVGRIVQGDPWEAQEKDAEGNLRVVKTGPNAGQPNPQYFIAVAFPKMLPNPTTGVMEPNPDFAQFYGVLDRMARTSWPQYFPNGGACTLRDFAWKVKDGDSTEVDKKGRRNCDKEGFAGNWIVSFASSYAPKIMQNRGGAFVQVTEAEKHLLKRGYWVRVAGNTSSNESTQTPGLYVNFDLVEIIAPGEEIVSGMDPNEAFAQPARLPPGVTAVPAGGAPAPLPDAAAPASPGAASPAPASPAPAPAPAAAPAPAPAPAAAPAPAPAPAAAPAPAPAPAPAAAPAPPAAAPHAGFIPAPVMTEAAGGVTYEQYKAAGWTDDQLIQGGLMIA